MHAHTAEHELDIVRVARELAIDHAEPEEILARYKVDTEAWLKLQRDPRFQKILDAELIAWNSAANVHERTKLKAAALIEDFLPEASQRLHDKVESLNGKVELFKALARIAGMGLENAKIEGTGEKFSVTINLGENKLQFAKDVTPTSGVVASSGAPPPYVNVSPEERWKPAGVFALHHAGQGDRGADPGDVL